MRASAEARVIAGRYARALLQVVLDKGEDPERVEDDLGEVHGLLETEPELARFLTSPAVPAEKRGALVDRLLEDFDVNPYSAKLLRLLAAKERMALLGLVRERYREALDEHLKIVSAEVTTAHRLTDGQKETLASQLRALTGKSVRLQIREDPDLLGGLVVRIGNRIYDASVVSQLQRFKRHVLSSY
ncbi:MAG: ATP synthase F1 subunit delta [Acidobacteriota bacterium]